MKTVLRTLTTALAVVAMAACEQAEPQIDVAASQLTCAPDDVDRTGPNPLQLIAKIVADSLDSIDDQELRDLMYNHVAQLRLVDGDGLWNAPELEAIGEQLLPSDITIEDAKYFVEEVATIAEKNDYLTDFLWKAKDEEFSGLLEKVEQEGDDIFPDVVAYGLVQQALTKAMHDDWQLIAVCKEIWEVKADEAKITDYMELFDHVKLASVKQPIDRFIEYHEAQSVPHDFMRKMLPLNIMEAVAVDVTQWNMDNANTGRILAWYRPGSEEWKSTGEGPTQFSDDGLSILFNMALAKKWADLYSTWNLAFVSHYSHFPYVFVKLLIPQVHEYEDEPAEYIYNRALALHTHLYWAFLGRADGTTSKMDWENKELTKFWGKVNSDNAQSYDKDVKTVGGGS